MDRSSAPNRPVKVSHSLRPDIIERLKEIAYWERVSESSIIEFLLQEFFALGDNGALRSVIQESVASPRRQRFAKPPDTNSASDPAQRLSIARRSFADAVDKWRRRTTLANFNDVGLARLELVAARAKVAASGNAADVESV